METVYMVETGEGDCLVRQGYRSQCSSVDCDEAASLI